jgi:hypothetical protein
MEIKTTSTVNIRKVTRSPYRRGFFSVGKALATPHETKYVIHVESKVPDRNAAGRVTIQLLSFIVFPTRLDSFDILKSFGTKPFRKLYPTKELSIRYKTPSIFNSPGFTVYIFVIIAQH